MLRRTSLLLPCLVGVVGATHEAGQPGKAGEVLTPDQASRSRQAGYLTVEFRVNSVGMLTGWQPEGMPPHLSPYQLVAAALEGGGEFHVYLNGKLLEDLNRLAIEPSGHFGGSVVRVTGTVREVEVSDAGKMRNDYQMVVLDLDKIRVMERPRK